MLGFVVHGLVRLSDVMPGRLGKDLVCIEHVMFSYVV